MICVNNLGLLEFIATIQPKELLNCTIFFPNFSFIVFFSFLFLFFLFSFFFFLFLFSFVSFFFHFHSYCQAITKQKMEKYRKFGGKQLEGTISIELGNLTQLQYMYIIFIEYITFVTISSIYSIRIFMPIN